MKYKNIIVKNYVKNGEDAKCEVTYDKCKVYYNGNEGSFYYQPYDLTNKKYYGNLSGTGWVMLGDRETSMDVARPFTDIIDAMKLLFGYSEFTNKRVQALWEAYKGKHDLFSTKIRAYFYPTTK